MHEAHGKIAKVDLLASNSGPIECNLDAIKEIRVKHCSICKKKRGCQNVEKPSTPVTVGATLVERVRKKFAFR